MISFVDVFCRLDLLVVMQIWWLFLLFRLVSGAGDIKLTKDGNVLLHEMVRVLRLHFKYWNRYNINEQDAVSDFFYDFFQSSF